jgi:lysozyme
VSRALLIGAGVAAIAALGWWRGRGADELGAELEDLAGMNPTAAALFEISLDPNVGAFLQMIRAGEGTAGADGYRTLYGGGLVDHLADHPRERVTRPLGGKLITSTAAGAYQFLERTWDEVAAALELPDFSPASQDIAAVYLIRRRGALADVRAGRFEAAVAKCAREWASLPGSPYGQPTKSLDQARNVYAAAGGSFA